jgi:hypothetical protein
LPIVARSAAVVDPEDVWEIRIVVASLLAAKDTDDSVASSREESEGVPGWIASLLIVVCSQFPNVMVSGLLLASRNSPHG